MNRTILVAVGILVLASITGGFLYVRSHDEKPLEVQTAPAEKHRIVQKVNATGKIQPVTQVKISADVSSKILAIHVKEGDWVNKGDLLVELDKERYAAAVEAAEANVRSAEANARLVAENRNKVEKELKRVTEMFGRKLDSQANLDTARAAYKVEVARYQSAADQVKQAEGMLKQAKDQLSKTTLYAPMSGTISDLNKQVGEIAIGSQFQEDVILVVADLSSMEARVNVDENDIVSVKVGAKAEIAVDALPNRTVTGTVTDIANSANITGEGTNNQKTEFEVKIGIKPAVKELRPGMTASADIITGVKESTLGVPIQSVALRSAEQLQQEAKKVGDKTEFKGDRDGFVEVVFVVNNNVAMARAVKTGLQSDQYIEILKGLSAGDQIVTGSYRVISRDLKDGARVAIDNSDDGSTT